MINRLVYEIRLRKVSHKPSIKKGQRWRWDVDPYLTTDPEFPGVETGRSALRKSTLYWGYTRYKWQAMRKIANLMLDNEHRDNYVER